MSKTPKFDMSKLQKFLDSLGITVEDVEKFCAPRSPLEMLMDKYDMAKLSNYENVSTREFPVLAKPTSTNRYSFPSSNSNRYYSNQALHFSNVYMPTWQGMQSYAFGYLMGVDVDEETAAPPVETPQQKLKKKIVQLQGANSVKLADPKPAPPAPARSPDYVHTITAWRGWSVVGDKLRSLAADSNWEPKRALKATCIHNCLEAPHIDCSCGYWSFKTLDLLTQAIDCYTAKIVVLGTVEIWGRVIECTNGFRSEYAYPKELWLLKNGIESLSWNYGVPVRRVEE